MHKTSHQNMFLPPIISQQDGFSVLLIFSSLSTTDSHPLPQRKYAYVQVAGEKEGGGARGKKMASKDTFWKTAKLG